MKDNCVCVVVVIIVIIILIAFCLLKSSQQHGSTLKLIGVKTKKTNALPIIAGTTTGAVLLSGGVVGLTIQSLNASIGANMLKALETYYNNAGIKSGRALLQELKGEYTYRGDWGLYKNTKTGDIKLFNENILEDGYDKSKTLTKFFKILDWDQSETELLQSGEMMKQDGYIIYTLSPKYSFKKFATDPFLYIDQDSELSINDAGELVVPIKQDIEEFSDLAQVVLKESAEISEVSVAELSESTLLAILGDEFGL